MSSHCILYKKDPSHNDSRPCSHIFPPPSPLSVISTSPPSSLPRLSGHTSRPQPRSLEEQAVVAYSAFLRTCPEYQYTWIIDNLRRTDFARLDRVGETYVDHMGGAPRAECLVRAHSDCLTQIFWVVIHTRSVTGQLPISQCLFDLICITNHTSSQLSSDCADEAKQTVLSFFQAPAGYTAIFTANATRALKLIAESFPFRKGSTFVLGTNSHNSVHGIRTARF